MKVFLQKSGTADLIFSGGKRIRGYATLMGVEIAGANEGHAVFSPASLDVTRTCAMTDLFTLRFADGMTRKVTATGTGPAGLKLRIKGKITDN